VVPHKAAGEYRELVEVIGRARAAGRLAQGRLHRDAAEASGAGQRGGEARVRDALRAHEVQRAPRSRPQGLAGEDRARVIDVYGLQEVPARARHGHRAGARHAAYL